MQINTLYQLLALVEGGFGPTGYRRDPGDHPGPVQLLEERADRLRFTNATTTQCYDPCKRDWAWPGTGRHGHSPPSFPAVDPARPCAWPAAARDRCADRRRGDPRGRPACHDTGSAVVAIPGRKTSFCLDQLGHLSIMGRRSGPPGISPLTLPTTSPTIGGVFGILAACPKHYGVVAGGRNAVAPGPQQGEALSYAELTRLAAGAQPFLAVIDADDSAFLHPGDMPARIQAFCRGEAARRCRTAKARSYGWPGGAALKYRWVLERLEESQRDTPGAHPTSSRGGTQNEAAQPAGRRRHRPGGGRRPGRGHGHRQCAHAGHRVGPPGLVGAGPPGRPPGFRSAGVFFQAKSGLGHGLPGLVAFTGKVE